MLIVIVLLALAEVRHLSLHSHAFQSVILDMFIALTPANANRPDHSSSVQKEVKVTCNVEYLCKSPHKQWVVYRIQWF